MSSLAPLLESFFTDRLYRQRQASPNTITSYRDSFCLILSFAKCKLGKEPSMLKIQDFTPEFVGDFLNHLESVRKNSARTRNARLAAIHSFFRYIATKQPENSAQIQQVLAIPQKRFTRKIVTFLNTDEMESLLKAPDQRNWMGRRDHAILLTALQTGLRVSELINLRIQDVVLCKGAHVKCLGKGRKERCTPLTKHTVEVLKSWLSEQAGIESDPIFSGINGGKLSRDSIERLVTKYVEAATKDCPTLKDKKISPHSLRHSTAVQLLRANVDTSLIALYLGHESSQTTQIYLHADLSTKEKAIARVTPIRSRNRRYRPSDKLLSFLECL
jgi:site-specific recombinase XerD